MIKRGLVTINGNYNYGNKLQHYALQKYIQDLDKSIVETIYCYEQKKIIFRLKSIFKCFLKKRYRNFSCFDKYINYSQTYFYNNKIYNDCNYNDYIVGSDQVWNVNFPFFTKDFLLYNINSSRKMSYASSFGINELPSKYKVLFKNELMKFKNISVREEAGKKIIEELTGRTDVEVLIDPTMLLTADEWDKVSKKPTMLKNDKYILNYFLGNLSDKRRNEINRVAKENNCEVINILDKESPFYECGPSEFLYLEKNAFLICTDSFHSSVFGILYNTPFLVFEREDNNASMNSRLDTLLSKFKLEDRRYKGKITKKDLKCDYKEAYNILDKERIKSMNFLKKALDIKDSDKNE